MTLTIREKRRVEVMRRGEKRVARKEEQARIDGFYPYRGGNQGSPYYRTYAKAKAAALMLRNHGNVVRIIKDDRYAPNLEPNYKIFWKAPKIPAAEIRRAYR